MFIIIFLIILATLVFVHELGHFLAAKAAGIRVDEFAIGFPPKIFSFKKGETKYALNLIPFGGYVKIFGEDYEEGKAIEEGNAPDKERSFVGKPKWVQSVVLLAGIFFNILFAWVLISVGLMFGTPVPANYDGPGSVQNAEITVTSVQADSPAKTAGLEPGDKIMALSASDQTIQKPTVEDLMSFTSAHKDQPIELSIIRVTEDKTVTVTPTVRGGGDKATIGITMDSLGTLKLPFFSAIVEGVKLTSNLVQTTAVQLALFLKTAVTGGAKLGDVTGPVGIALLVNDATRFGYSYLLTFTAFISINLALINLVPFPALDGGRVLFVIIEKIRGKALNTKAVQIVNATGLGLLLLLMVVITFKDIINLF